MASTRTISDHELVLLGTSSKTEKLSYDLATPLIMTCRTSAHFTLLKHTSICGVEPDPDFLPKHRKASFRSTSPRLPLITRQFSTAAPEPMISACTSSVWLPVSRSMGRTRQPRRV